MSVSWKCPECGLEYDTILPKDAVTALKSYPRRYNEFFPPRDDDEKPDGVIHRRPEPTVWSALEYAAHVGDVEDDLTELVRRMTIEDNPPLAHGFDPDERASDAAYSTQPKDAVLDHLRAAFENAAATAERVPNDGWHRTATFSFGERDILDMVRNAVHEGYHHLRDIENVLRRVVGS